MRVAGDDRPASTPYSRSRRVDDSLERLERLGRLEVADVLADEDVGADRQRDGVLQVRADGQHCRSARRPVAVARAAARSRAPGAASARGRPPRARSNRPRGGRSGRSCTRKTSASPRSRSSASRSSVQIGSSRHGCRSWPRPGIPGRPAAGGAAACTAASRPGTGCPAPPRRPLRSRPGPRPMGHRRRPHAARPRRPAFAAARSALRATSSSARLAVAHLARRP